MASVLTNLKDSRLRLKHLQLDKTGWDALYKGLRKIYRQGHGRMQTAYEKDERFCLSRMAQASQRPVVRHPAVEVNLASHDESLADRSPSALEILGR